jgi:hypothetical protein
MKGGRAMKKNCIIVVITVAGMLLLSGCVSAPNANGRVTRGLEVRVGGYAEQMTCPTTAVPQLVMQYQNVPPAAPVQAAPAPCAVPVKAENCNGSYNVIYVSQTDDGNYQGPRGEIYTGMPDEAAISQMYGFK